MSTEATTLEWKNENNVNEVHIETDNVDDTLLEMRWSLAEKKKRFRMNMVEFIIWCILLVIAFNYLKTHPAEKTSIFAGVEVLLQKAEVFLWNITGKNGEEVRKQHELERYFKELISTMDAWKCVNVKTLEQAKKRLESLESFSSEQFTKSRQVYEWYARSYATKIQESCSD